MTLTKVLVLLIFDSTSDYAEATSSPERRVAFEWLVKHKYIEYIGDDCLVTPMGSAFVNDLQLLACQEFASSPVTP